MTRGSRSCVGQDVVAPWLAIDVCVSLRYESPCVTRTCRFGTTRSSAMAGRRRSSPGTDLDWWCLPNLDSPSVFGALLDTDRGGRWILRPEDAAQIGEDLRLRRAFCRRPGGSGRSSASS